MTTGCCGGNGETLIFTCAGAAYSGQVANRSGVQLMEQGAGTGGVLRLTTVNQELRASA